MIHPVWVALVTLCHTVGLEGPLFSALGAPGPPWAPHSQETGLLGLGSGQGLGTASLHSPQAVVSDMDENVRVFSRKPYPWMRN